MANNKLVLELVADSNNLLKAMEQSQKSINNFVRAADGAGSQLGQVNRVMGSFTSLTSGGALAAGVLAGALLTASTAGVAMAISAGKQAEQMDQLSAITGIGTDKLQDYEVVLNRANLTGQDLVQVMKHVSTSLDQAKQGTGSAADRFRQLGIDIRTVTSTDDLIRKIAQSSNQFANGAEKAAVMSDLLGKGWATFIKAFGGGTKAMDDAAAASERLGATLSGGQIAGLAAMDDSVDDLTLAWERFGQQLGSFVAPAVKFASEALSSLLGMASNALKSMNALAGIGGAADTRSKPPPMIDTGKAAAAAQAIADAQLKANESLFRQESSLASARLNMFKANLDAQKSLNLSTDLDITRAHGQALVTMAQFDEESLSVQLSNYKKFSADKSSLFKTDEAGAQAKAKFEIEAATKVLELESQIRAAAINTSTVKIQTSAATAVAIREQQIQPLQDEIDKYAALDQGQQALFSSEQGLMGASAAARQVRFALIDAEAAKTRTVIEQTIQGEERKAQKLLDLDEMVDAKRRQAVQQFPSFFEQQMQTIVASSAFSMGAMVSTWSGGIAQMAIHGGNLQAVWEQTQVAIVQASLNAGVQQLAQLGIWASQKAGLLAADAAAETAMNAAKNAEIVAGETAAATATAGVWAGASIAVEGFFTASIASFEAMVASMASILTAVGEFVMGVLSAIAEALADTIFGIPWALAIVGGIVLIAAALAATGNLGFKDGGIGNFGSGTPATLHGQEAIIPLNSRGAAFMQDAMGGGGGGQMTVVMQIDGREIARRTMEYMPGIIYMKTGMA